MPTGGHGDGLCEPRGRVLPPVQGTVCALRRSSPPPSPSVHVRCCCRPPHLLSWPHGPHFLTTLQGARRPSLWPPLHFGTCGACGAGTALSTRRARRTPALRASQGITTCGLQHPRPVTDTRPRQPARLNPRHPKREAPREKREGRPSTVLSAPQGAYFGIINGRYKCVFLRLHVVL